MYARARKHTHMLPPNPPLFLALSLLLSQTYTHQVYTSLINGGTIGIFPEGGTHDGTQARNLSLSPILGLDHPAHPAS